MGLRLFYEKLFHLLLALKVLMALPEKHDERKKRKQFSMIGTFQCDLILLVVVYRIINVLQDNETKMMQVRILYVFVQNLLELLLENKVHDDCFPKSFDM